MCDRTGQCTVKRWHAPASKIFEAQAHLPHEAFKQDTRTADRSINAVVHCAVIIVVVVVCVWETIVCGVIKLARHGVRTRAAVDGGWPLSDLSFSSTTRSLPLLANQAQLVI